MICKLRIPLLLAVAMSLAGWPAASAQARRGARKNADPKASAARTASSVTQEAPAAPEAEVSSPQDESRAAEPRELLRVEPQPLVLRSEAGRRVGEFNITPLAEGTLFWIVESHELRFHVHRGAVDPAAREIVAGRAYRIAQFPLVLEVEHRGKEASLKPFVLRSNAGSTQGREVSVDIQLPAGSWFGSWLDPALVPWLQFIAVVAVAVLVLYVGLRRLLRPEWGWDEQTQRPVQRPWGLRLRIRRPRPPEPVPTPYPASTPAVEPHLQTPAAMAAAAGAGAGGAAAPAPAPAPAGPEPDALSVVWLHINKLRAEVTGLTDEVKNCLSPIDEKLRGLAEATASTNQKLEKLQATLGPPEAETETEVSHAQEATGTWKLLLGNALSAQPRLSAEVAQQIQQRLLDFFARSVPGPNGLPELSQQAAGLLQAFQELADWVRRRTPDSKALPRLSELEQATHDLCREIDAARQSLQVRQLRLHFACEVSSYPDARQTLFVGLAESLVAEVAKWENPQQHFTVLLEGLADGSVPAAADVCDRELDPARANPELQSLLSRLFAAAGLEEISVQPRGSFDQGLHVLIQMVRGSPDEARHTVAHLVNRGFLRDGRVLRKAAVELFE